MGTNMMFFAQIVMNNNVEEEASNVINNFKLSFQEAYGLPYRTCFQNMRTNPIQRISDNDNQLSMVDLLCFISSALFFLGN